MNEFRKMKKKKNTNEEIIGRSSWFYLFTETEKLGVKEKGGKTHEHEGNEGRNR